MPARHLVFASIVLVLGLPASSSAAEPGDEVTALEDEIARDDVALSTGDCAVACQALVSMRRAAERLCALDPGARCAGARAKVRDAAGRVRAACPGCGLAEDEAPPVAAERASESPQAAPPPRGGGCAGCALGDGERGGAGMIALALAWVLARLGRRRRR